MGNVRDEFYYDTEFGKQTDESGLYSEVPQPCSVCRNLTHRIDVTFEAYLCNADRPVLLREYQAALAKNNE